MSNKSWLLRVGRDEMYSDCTQHSNAESVSQSDSEVWSQRVKGEGRMPFGAVI